MWTIAKDFTKIKKRGDNNKKFNLYFNNLSKYKLWILLNQEILDILTDLFLVL